MDIITIKSLKFHGKHGYYSEEIEKGNNFEVDVIAEGNFRQSVLNDDLNSTFNYELVEDVAGSVFSGPPERLIETLCHMIGEQLCEKDSNVTKLTVSVRKMNPPIKSGAEYAQITMEWNR